MIIWGWAAGNETSGLPQQRTPVIPTPERWKQENQQFKTVFHRLSSWRATWVTWDLVSFSIIKKVQCSQGTWELISKQTNMNARKQAKSKGLEKLKGFWNSVFTFNPQFLHTCLEIPWFWGRNFVACLSVSEYMWTWDVCF